MRIVIAEDNTLLRDGLSLVLADHGLTVVAAVGDGEELLDAVDRHLPDLAIVDVRMPPTHTDEGIRAALEVRARHPGCAVLVFSQWIETTYAQRLVAGSPSGIGYLLKDRVTHTADFIDAVHRVAGGGTALDPDVVRQLLGTSTARRASDAGLSRLSRREHEALALLAEGLSNQAIAARLVLGVRSVEKLVAAIFTKLDLPPHPDEHRRVLAVLRYLDPA